MPDEQEIELIDYLNVIWKRKGLIIGGTLLGAATALVVSLSMPKTYEVSRTLKIGQLPTGTYRTDKLIRLLWRQLMPGFIENHATVIARLRNQRILKMAIDTIYLGSTAREMEASIWIDTNTNPDVRYTVRAHDAQHAIRIADFLADNIIKIHRPIFERGMQIAQEYEVELAAKIGSLETENLKMKKMLKRIIEAPDVDPTTVVLFEAGIGERERNLADVRRELKQVRLSHLGFENTSVITGLNSLLPVETGVKLNVVLASTLGLMIFTLIAFFLEYIEKAKDEGE